MLTVIISSSRSSRCCCCHINVPVGSCVIVIKYAVRSTGITTLLVRRRLVQLFLVGICVYVLAAPSAFKKQIGTGTHG